jgi:hypothetical protein
MASRILSRRVTDLPVGEFLARYPSLRRARWPCDQPPVLPLSAERLNLPQLARRQPPQDDDFNIVRGIGWGVVLGTALWAGIFAGLWLLRH